MRDAEMGQGIWTGASMLLAEELDLGLDQVTTDFAPPNNKLYANPLLHQQATGGSTSIRGDWNDLRKAAATRALRWCRPRRSNGRCEPAACAVARGVVTHTASGRHSELRVAGRARRYVAAAVGCHRSRIARTGP